MLKTLKGYSLTQDAADFEEAITQRVEKGAELLSLMTPKSPKSAPSPLKP